MTASELTRQAGILGQRLEDALGHAQALHRACAEADEEGMTQTRVKQLLTAQLVLTLALREAGEAHDKVVDELEKAEKDAS